MAQPNVRRYRYTMASVLRPLGESVVLLVAGLLLWHGLRQFIAAKPHLEAALPYVLAFVVLGRVALAVPQIIQRRGFYIDISPDLLDLSTGEQIQREDACGIESSTLMPKTPMFRTRSLTLIYKRFGVDRKMHFDDGFEGCDEIERWYTDGL